MAAHRACLMHETNLIERLVCSEEFDVGRESGHNEQVVERAEKRAVAGDYRIDCRAPIRKVGAVEAIEKSPSKRLEL